MPIKLRPVSAASRGGRLHGGHLVGLARVVQVAKRGGGVERNRPSECVPDSIVPDRCERDGVGCRDCIAARGLQGLHPRQQRPG